MTDILIVEDNIELAELIQAFLFREGFSCYHALSAEAGLNWLKENKPQVILLDIMLPDMDGFAFCQSVRHHSRLPIFIMSARSTKTDQLMGFELGADDYMEKPIDPDILCAKIRALIARQKQVPKQSAIIISGALTVDKEARQVYLKDKRLELNVKEYELLILFIENAGKTLHKEYLFNQIWGMDSMSENQTLTVHIKMLRSKIEEETRQPKRILTVWGIGYRYEEI
ncbi:response regulator transcription factor [Beduini massiliensis]|uniref:response regulator transcription factor n=1 Tax=Beduini massiliensis TaxID=1585974 RepID=UPI00059A81CD|nr:response regulator transcription factor [Beduini massiliensis]